MALTFGKGNRSVAFNPTSAFPLDARSYFESYELAAAAALTAEEAGSSSTQYYFGQSIAVVENGVASFYIIQPDGTLGEVGGKIEVDENVFVFDSDEKLTLANYADASTGAQLTKGADGKLRWVMPDTTTAEGQAAEISALKDRATVLETTVNGKAAVGEEGTEGYVPAVEGLTTKVANNAAAIAAEITRAKEAEKALDDAIKAIDFVDNVELANAIKDFATEAYVNGEIDKLEEAIGALNHFKAEVVDSVDKVTDTGVLYLIKDETATGVDKYNEYILVGDVATLIGDTTTDLSNYYNKTEINTTVLELQNAIEAEGTARGALADRVAELEAVDNATQAELDAYKLEVTAEIGEAKTALTGDIAEAKEEVLGTVDTKLAAKVDNSTFESFKETNTEAIATAKQAAIDAAAAAEEAKGYAVATEVANTYATKVEVNAVAAELDNYAKKTEVETSLEGKVDKVEGSRLINSAEVEKLNNLLEVKSVDNITISKNDEGTLSVKAITTDKITGLEDWVTDNAAKLKGLSENNLTDAMVTKLTGIEAGAEKNYVRSVTDELEVSEAGQLGVKSIVAAKVVGLDELLKTKVDVSAFNSLSAEVEDVKAAITWVELK
jgi:hypothetical protein